LRKGKKEKGKGIEKKEKGKRKNEAKQSREKGKRRERTSWRLLNSGLVVRSFLRRLPAVPWLLQYTV
jgi:hypothetical protein